MADRAAIYLARLIAWAETFRRHTPIPDGQVIYNADGQPLGTAAQHRQTQQEPARHV